MKFEKQDYQTSCVNNIIELLKDFDFNKPTQSNLNDCFTDFYKNHGKHLPHKKQSYNKMNIDVLMETGTGKTFTYLKTIFELNKVYNQTKFIIFVPRTAIKESIIQNIKLTAEYFNEEYKKKIHLRDNNSQSSSKKSTIPSGISEFINPSNPNIDLLILTNNLIDKKGKNILNKPQEHLFFNNTQKTNNPLQALQNLNPIIIIDEPHLLKGEKFIAAFKDFKSIHFRFGATFPKEKEHELSNLVYCLDSITAFNNYLVKQIIVSNTNNHNNSLKLFSTDSKQKKFSISYSTNNQEDKKITLSLQQDIGQQTGLQNYIGIKATKITKDKVTLSDTQILQPHFSYKLEEQEAKNLIKATIEKHFEKEEYLFHKGIKTLSLFFIENIADYKTQDNKEIPPIKNIFQQQYKQKREEVLKNPNLSPEYKNYLLQDYNQDNNLIVDDGYFSTSKNTKDEEEREAVNLILKDKENLLSFKKPLRFIFSVWALQEGWDNPNIFNICKLSSTNQETTNRQQVGRGLRLPVNQKGERITINTCNEQEFYKINSLDVFVSGQEGNFIENLQKEINDSSFSVKINFTLQDLQDKANLNSKEAIQILCLLESNNFITFQDQQDIYTINKPVRDFLQQQKQQNQLNFLKNEESYQNLLNFFPQNNNNYLQVKSSKQKNQTVSIKKDLYQSFKPLWELINKQATISYDKSLSTNQQQLFQDIISNFNQKIINPVKFTLTTKKYDSQHNQITKLKDEELEKADFSNKDLYQDFILSITTNEKFPLPLNFILNLINQILLNKDAKEKIENNPKLAKQYLIESIIDKTHKNLVSAIKYNFDSITAQNNISNISLLEATEININTLGKYIDEETTPPEHYLYNKIVYDSEIEKNTITQDPKQVNNYTITVFAKLPKISIQTPFKTYNPDFAYMLADKADSNKKLFFIAETKGYNNLNEIPLQEKLKIDYAEKFFLALSNTYNNSNLKIAFKTRLNTNTLLDLIKGI